MKSFNKMLLKALGYMVSPFAVGLVITLSVTYLASLYYSRDQLVKDDHSWVSLIEALHQKTVDWRLTDRGQLPGSSRVAILAVDEKAIEQEGRWPWSREKQAQVVERALKAGAKSVSFDIVYSEEDQNSSLPTLRRLKRTFAVGATANSTAANAVDTELNRDDSDQIFAKMIEKYSDRLILGAFFDNSKPEKPLQELCSDALFQRTREARYWAKEPNRPQITDESLESLAFPKEIAEHLRDYATQLEVTRAQQWFDGNKQLEPRITESLEDLAKALPPETYPPLATLWLNNDTESAKLLLEQARPDLANAAGAQLLFTRFSYAFTKKEAASLASELRDVDGKYCERFFTERDELLSLNEYKAKYPGAEDTFKDQSWATVWPQTALARQPAAQGPHPESLEAEVSWLATHALKNAVLDIERWSINTPLISWPTKHTGYFNAQLDNDGTIRRSPLVVRDGNVYSTSLAFKTFLVDNGYTVAGRVEPDTSGYTRESMKALKPLEILDHDGNFVMRLPTDREGQLMINYSGRQKMFAHISAADILSDSPTMPIEVQVQDERGRWKTKQPTVEKAAFLKDKALFFGATATGVYDLRVTPFDENFPGVETHANILSNLIVENDRATHMNREPAYAPGFLRTSPREPFRMRIALLVLGLTLSGLLAYFGSLPGLGITALAMGGIYAVDRFYLFRSGVVTTVLFPMFEVGSTYVSLTFYKYFTEERTKRELKGTFEKYVSPAIVAEVLADPSNIELGGKKMELTVMFSDVRGFTTISEKLDPRQLSDLLNSYLTPMTDLVFKNKGTLDKYMGDAIMAFWGAPIHFPDHAHHACRCALQMITRLRELQASYRAKGLPEIDIGIGLNTGEMSVGNMGSETVRSYTVMGDSVNLGSRLEGINKQYGTRIIISEFTYAAVKAKFCTREIDWVRVKGKAQPVRIYELVAEGAAPENMRDVLQHFAEGFQLYHERKFAEAIYAFENGLRTKTDDAVTQLYLERCRDYLEEPPPDDWDGVFNMKSK